MENSLKNGNPHTMLKGISIIVKAISPNVAMEYETHQMDSFGSSRIDKNSNISILV